jgi:hypothetical protein
MKKKYLLMLLAVTLFFGFTGSTTIFAEDETPRPTDVKPITI